MANADLAEDGVARPPRKRTRNRNRNRTVQAQEALETVEEEALDIDEDYDEDEDDERLSRDQEARGDDVHDDDEYDDDWEPPELLDAPPARPGYVQRWIRTTINGLPDPRNVARRSNQAWRPRSMDTVPKNFYAPSIQHGEYAGYIGVEGMVLMERREKTQRRQKRQNQAMTNLLMQGVEGDLHNVHDPRSGLGQPSLRNKSTVTRGRPRPATDDD